MVSAVKNVSSREKQKERRNMMTESSVAHFREQQALHEQAAQQGLSGLAMVANHASITARMEQGAKRILGLIQEGKHDEAHALLFAENWDTEEQGKQTPHNEIHEEGGKE